jgi:hypothetical protein
MKKVADVTADACAGHNDLMPRYPNESVINKDAFFDYHCALDFL